LNHPWVEGCFGYFIPPKHFLVNQIPANPMVARPSVFLSELGVVVKSYIIKGGKKNE